MEGVAAIVGLVDLGLKYALEITQYINDVKHASTERQRMSSEVLLVSSTLVSLRGTLVEASSPSRRGKSIHIVLEHEESIKQLENLLKEITLRFFEPGGIPNSKSRSMIQALKWPFEKKEAEKKISEIARLRATVSLVVEKISLQQGSEIRDTVETKLFVDILTWLSPLDFRSAQKSPQFEATDGTGVWFITSISFLGWVEGRSPILWCHGIPGAGKSMLASKAYSYMRQRFKGTRKIVLLVSEQGFVDDVCKRLYQQSRDGQLSVLELTTEIDRISQIAGKDVFIVLDGLDEMPVGEERETLLSRLEALSPRPSLMAMSRPLPEIKEWFTQCAAVGGYRIQSEISISSPEQAEEGITVDDGGTDGNDGTGMFCWTIAIAAKPQDIDRYVDWRIASNSTFRKTISRSKMELQQTITAKLQSVVDVVAEDGRFIVARFYIDVLVEETATKGILRALEESPVGINALYADLLDRISSTHLLAKTRQIRRIVAFVAYAVESMNIRMMEDLLAIETNPDCLDEENVPDVHHLIGLTRGLLYLDQDENLRLAHDTLRQYVLDSHDTDFAETDAVLTLYCISMLRQDEFAVLEGQERLNTRKRMLHTSQTLEAVGVVHPFLMYAIDNWAVHARRTNDAKVAEIAADYLRSLSHDLTTQTFCHQSKIEVLNVRPYYSDEATSRWMMKGDRYCPAFNNLAMHFACKMGLTEVVKLIIDDFDINVQDGNGFTCLMYAAMDGNEDVARFLLEHGAEPAAIGPAGLTALHLAAMHSRPEILQMLLDIPPILSLENRVDEAGLHLKRRSARDERWISYCDFGRAQNYTEGSRMDDLEWRTTDSPDDIPYPWLFEIGREPNTLPFTASFVDVDLRSKVMKLQYKEYKLWAAEHGKASLYIVSKAHTGYNCQLSCYGGTPLQYAVLSGRSNNVKLLLSRGADPSAENSLQGTVLSRCAESDLLHYFILLVEGGGDIHEIGPAGESLLHVCAFSNSPDVLRYLLFEKKLNPIATDSYGRTPAFYAAQLGHYTCLLLLLGIQPDSVLKSLLVHFFIRRNLPGLLDAALEFNTDLDMEAKNSGGYTPLHMCILNSRDRCTDVLINRGADIDAISPEEWSARDYFHSLNCVEELLRAIDISFMIENGEDVVCEIPVSLAVYWRGRMVIERLKEMVDIA